MKDGPFFGGCICQKRFDTSWIPDGEDRILVLSASISEMAIRWPLSLFFCAVAVAVAGPASDRLLLLPK